MKIRLYAAGMIALLVITMLAGCQASAQEIQFKHSPETTQPLQTQPNETPPAPAQPVQIQPTESQPWQAQPKETTAPRKNQLSKEEAIAIALNHAGLTESQVKGMKAELDWDDGVQEYEVEFRCGGYEYDYDIHAETGAIRSWDKDWDD